MAKPLPVRPIRDLRDVVDARLPDAALVLDAARIRADQPMAATRAFGAALAAAEDAELRATDLVVDSTGSVAAEAVEEIGHR